MTKRRQTYIVFSVLAIVNILFMPVFEVWGGLFPSDRELYFLDVITIFFEGYYWYSPSESWNMWIVQLTTFILLPSIAMLVGAIINNRKVFGASALAGVILEGRILINYIIQEGIESLLDIEDCSISIGSWIAILLFSLAFICSLSDSDCTVSVSEECNVNLIETKEENNESSLKFCSQCGDSISDDYVFCIKCGMKINREKGE